MLIYRVITIFPQMFASPLDHSILKGPWRKDFDLGSVGGPARLHYDRHHVTDDSLTAVDKAWS